MFCSISYFERFTCWRSSVTIKLHDDAGCFTLKIASSTQCFVLSCGSTPTQLHRNGNVFILMKLSSLAALEVVKVTTSSAASDENFVKMTTFLFQCGRIFFMVTSMAPGQSLWSVSEWVNVWNKSTGNDNTIDKHGLLGGRYFQMYICISNEFCISKFIFVYALYLVYRNAYLYIQIYLCISNGKHMHIGFNHGVVP